MNTTFIAMLIAGMLGVGLVLIFGLLSLLSGGLHFLFARPRIEFLKSEHGDSGFAFFFSWNSAREPAKFDRVKVRLFNPFGTPTQVEVSRDFPAQGEDFVCDAYMGHGMKRILEAKGLEQGSIEVEVISQKNALSQIFLFKAIQFRQKLAQATESAKDRKNSLPGPEPKPLYTTVQRSFISKPLLGGQKTIRLATNPEFAEEFAGAEGAEGSAQENFEASKVWIEPGCIVCNACEGIYPEVFEVTDETCLIRPDAPLHDGLKILEAADSCPVEVIKFTKK